MRYYDTWRFLSTLTFLKVWNFFRIFVSYHFSVLTRKPFHRGMPYSLSVEPTTSCNLRCPECPSGQRIFSRPTGHLMPDDFKEYIKDISPYLLNLMLYFQGEPFLNRHFMALVAHAKSRNIYTMTSTNGHFLDNENAALLVQSGLDRLIISFDGTTQDVYARYRREGSLEQVRQGIFNILEERKKQRKRHPRIILQFLVMGHNEHQMEEARNFAAELGISLQFKSAQVVDIESNSWIIPVNHKRFIRYIRKDDGNYVIRNRMPDRCYRMWSGAVLTWDGNVVPCCFDKDADWVMGNLLKQSIGNIWKGEAYNHFRKKVFSDRKGLTICRNCTEGLR